MNNTNTVSIDTDTRIIRTQRDGTELNSARVISNIFFTEQKEKNLDKEFTLSMMQWGQVVSHDITGTSGKTGKLNKTMTV